MSTFAIHFVSVGEGVLGISELPGRGGDYFSDLQTIIQWRPDMALSLTSLKEMQEHDAGCLGADLSSNGIFWEQAEIADFGTPDATFMSLWPDTSRAIRTALANGRRIWIHCRGGCGRSGMIALRILVELGEDPDAALTRLRAVRPCAVETEAQRLWAGSMA